MSLHLKSFGTVSPAHVPAQSFLTYSTWQVHGMAISKAFVPTSLQKVFSPWCFHINVLLFMIAQSCLREISVKPSREAKPASLVAAFYLNSSLTLQSTEQTWAAKWCREVILVLSNGVHTFRMFFFLSLCRTHNHSGKKTIFIYPFISLPKTHELMNINRKAYRWKSAGT